MPSREYLTQLEHQDPNIRDLVEQLTAYGLRYQAFRQSHLILMEVTGISPEIISLEVQRQLDEMPSKEFH